MLPVPDWFIGFILTYFSLPTFSIFISMISNLKFFVKYSMNFEKYFQLFCIFIFKIFLHCDSQFFSTQISKKEKIYEKEQSEVHTLELNTGSRSVSHLCF